MNDGLRVRVLTGADPDLPAFVPDLARLRIAVFRDFPYLYDGTLAYEERYISTYLECPESLFVLALDGATVVGVATALPLASETDAFKQPFVDTGIDPERVFYCGESVLLPAWRGRGLYRQFLGERERYARLIRSFYDRAGFEVFMSPQPVLQLPRSVARLVGGQTDPGLADRLRLRLFDTVCRLQRRRNIAPPIPSLR